jgi:predicted membrane channel-forming protein YqfA (hemolysin III family)|uniref:Uncharacterized protein n=1 Tax=candidate division WOR-3 bacterium TaxID=2052148 RepID=A0A7V3KP97_UNCW3
MSLSAIWDRFWWSLMLTIFLGLIWLKFLEPVITCESAGLIVCITVGLIYFSVGIRNMVKKHKNEIEVEQRAYEELLAELQQGNGK